MKTALIIAALVLIWLLLRPPSRQAQSRPPEAGPDLPYTVEAVCPACQRRWPGSAPLLLRCPQDNTALVVSINGRPV